MRWLTLYLRSRQVPTALVGALACVIVVAQLGSRSTNPHQSVVSGVLALALGQAVLGYGLGGADPALEHTAAIRWAPRRAAHILAMTAVVAGTVLTVGNAPAGVVARDAAGLAGLTALAATLLSRQLAWTLPVAWAGASATIPPITDPAVLRVLTWPTQAPNSTAATLVAGTLAITGLTIYAVRGCPRT